MNTTTTRVSRKNTPSVMDRKLRIKIINRNIVITISKHMRKNRLSVLVVRLVQAFELSSKAVYERMKQVAYS